MSATREDVTFESGGERIAAWFYPGEGDGADQRPCVVMAHGFVGVKEARLDAFAERFAAAGLACLVFDYRHFGGSSGEPRQLLDIARQHADWHAALAFARAHERVDAARVALWGSSFSGGHVLEVAAADGNVAAVVSQVPFMDGIATLGALGAKAAVQATGHGLRDLVRVVRGGSPHYVPAVGPAGGSYAVMNQPGNEDGYGAIVGAAPTWRNEVAARILLRLGVYRPGTKASKVTAPILFIAATDDNLVPVAAVRKAAARAPDARVVELETGHFEPYLGELFERTVAEETSFLLEKLGAGAAAEAESAAAS